MYYLVANNNQSVICKCEHLEDAKAFRARWLKSDPVIFATGIEIQEEGKFYVALWNKQTCTYEAINTDTYPVKCLARNALEVARNNALADFCTENYMLEEKDYLERYEELEISFVVLERA